MEFRGVLAHMVPDGYQENNSNNYGNYGTLDGIWWFQIRPGQPGTAMETAVLKKQKTQACQGDMDQIMSSDFTFRLVNLFCINGSMGWRENP